MKLATWNVNSLAVRLPQVLQWLAANPVDALVLQETKLTDDKFPAAEIEAAGYHVAWFGQRTYNGVALLSKMPAEDLVRNIPGFDDDMARVITGTIRLNGVNQLVNLHAIDQRQLRRSERIEMLEQAFGETLANLDRQFVTYMLRVR